MRDLKQSTAVTVKIGPFVDSTDGATAETGLTIQKADVRLSKNGGDMAAAAADQGASDAGAAQDELGYYDISLGTGDTDTLGHLKVMITESGALPVWEDFHIMPANVWDSLYGADRLQVDVEEIGAGMITAAAIATNAIDADAIAADAVTEIQSGLATAAALATVDDFLDTEVAAILADTNELQTDLVNGGRLDLLIDAIKAKTDNLPTDPADDSDIDAQLATIAGYLDTEVAAIKAKTDLIPAAPAAVGDIPTAAAIADQVWDEAISGHLGAGSTGAALNAAGSAGDPWTTPLPGAYGAGTAGKLIGDNINAPIATVDTVVDAIKAKTDNLPADPADDSDIDAQLATIAGYLDTEVAAILADTNELQTDLVNGGRLDLLIDAIKAKTDNLPTDPADQSAVEAAITAATSPLATAAALATVDDFLDTEVAAILADTNELQTDLVNGGRLDLLIDAIKAKTDNLPADPADDSDIDTQLATIAGYLDTEVAAIKAKTDLIPAAPAAVGDIPTAAAIADQVWDEAIAGHLGVGSTGEALNAAGGGATPSAIADAVWDEALADHDGAGSAGEALEAAGGAADPLLNTVPGSYASGTAGAALGRIGSGQIETTSVVAESGDVETIQGDDYETADGRALDWTDTSASWPTLTSATIAVVIGGIASLAGEVVTATGDSKKVRLQLTGTQSQAIPTGKHIFIVKATLPGAGGNVITLVEGSWTSKKKQEA